MGPRRCTGSRSTRSRTRLNRGERRAAWWYRLRGWRILAANVRAGGGELDLIVRRGRVLRFVEVKERRRAAYGGAAGAVGAAKQRHVRRAALAWLGAHPECASLDVGFDVVAIEAGRVTRLGDAF
ncbi:MAG: YraN family protein [Actinomycetota bacterium]